MSHADVELEIHQAILIAAKHILDVQKGFDPKICIPVGLLATQLSNMLRASASLAMLETALVRDVDKMYEMDLNPDYYFNILPTFLSETKVARLINSYKSGKSEEFARKVSTAVEESRNAIDEDVESFPLLECQLSKFGSVTVPCGINAIDSRMNGGLGKGEFGVVCGISGLGKTSVGINFGWGACVRNYKIVFITLELPGKKISERLYSRITQIDYNRLRYGDGDDNDMIAVTAEKDRILATYNRQILKNFKIWDYSDKPCCLKEIKRRLLTLTKEEMPDMIFLDWLDALESDPTERVSGYVAKELRHQLQNYSKGCSNLAKEFNVAFWTATQANAKGDNQREVRMTNAAEGFSKAWRCSVFLGIGATDQDRENGRMTVKATKMRDGQIFETQILSRLDKQTFEDIPPDLIHAVPAPANFTPVRERNTQTTQ